MKHSQGATRAVASIICTRWKQTIQQKARKALSCDNSGDDCGDGSGSDGGAAAAVAVTAVVAIAASAADGNCGGMLL